MSRSSDFSQFLRDHNISGSAQGSCDDQGSEMPYTLVTDLSEEKIPIESRLYAQILAEAITIGSDFDMFLAVKRQDEGAIFLAACFPGVGYIFACLFKEGWSVSHRRYRRNSEVEDDTGHSADRSFDEAVELIDRFVLCHGKS